MSRKALDLRLYLVTDRPLCMGRDIVEIALGAVKGGTRVVQLREKSATFEEFVDLARRLKRLLDPFGVPLIINDRVDVALAVGAGGVHLGQADTPVAAARKVLGRDAVIGLSVESMDQVLAAEALDVDYLGVSPVFATRTKPDAAAPWGLEGLRSVRVASRHRLVGIGAITSRNAAEVIRSGAHGVAVVSAICSAVDPRRAAKELLDEVERAGLGLDCSPSAMGGDEV
jgi:thiamine-phosphate pyrophosphorylase